MAMADLSSAQRHVFVALKRRGEASADELAEALGITPSGVRQHLAALKSAGPGRLPSGKGSARTARRSLPQHRSGRGPVRQILRRPLGRAARPHRGGRPRAHPRVFERRRRRRVEQARDQLAGKSLDEKVAVLAKILDGEGYLADFDKLPDGSYRMTLHSCAIWAVASRYGQACATELEFLREVLPEAEIERVAHKVAGAYVCGYEIRPRAAKPRAPRQQARRDRTSA